MNSKKVIFASLVFVILWARAVAGQSSDQSLPTPVLSNEISGKIVALDVGDPRATRHFYAFAAKPGDLLITVDSANLNGDVDVFTAITFRPLVKTTVYASTQSPQVTKGIYLRARQILILRVEARTPNDDPGTYHIRLGGTFEPFSGGIPVAENTEPAESLTKASANRLSSVGATIPRPPAEVTATAEAKPSPSPEKATETPSEEASKKETEKPAKTAGSPRTTARGPRRGARPAPTRKQPPAKKPDATDKTETESPKAEQSKIEILKDEKIVPTEQPSVTAPGEKPKPQELSPAPVGARLIIEEKDGTRIERPMSTVRRVVVEGPTIVIVLKTGKIERINMSDVSRMAIEPQ
ncbi:MAG TPA: hypothetical protein DC054_26740 [Blastocatellia bacterium]|nr:hypothetical protein [Blastocatellia bacterium]